MPYAVARNPALINKSKQGGKIPSASVNTAVVKVLAVASTTSTKISSSTIVNLSVVKLVNTVVNSIKSNQNKTH